MINHNNKIYQYNWTMKEKEYCSEVCDKCGKPMKIRIGRFGQFLACSSYRICKNTKHVGHVEEQFN